MKVFRGLDNLPLFHNAVATMGSFDGVHSGHRELLRRVMDIASSVGGESIVLTFDPHPRYVLGTGEGMSLLTTLDEKLLLLERLGINNVIVIPFTTDFSHTSPEEFIERHIAPLGLHTLVVGYNHRFGHKKEGDYGFLERSAGFQVQMVEQQQVVGSKVSSTIVRQLLEQGQMEKAATLLSNPYILICDLDSEGCAVGIDEHKFLPAEGEYNAQVDDENVRVIVGDMRKLRVEPIREGRVMLEFK